MCCTQLAGNTGHRKSPFWHHRTTLSGYVFATEASINYRRKLVIWQDLLQMSSRYGELWPTNRWDLMASLGHPGKFQRVLHLGLVTAPTSLSGGEPNFTRCLAVSCAGILYIHFWGLLPPNGILPNSLCPSFAFSHIGSVTAWHSSSGASQSLRRDTRNGITELSQRAPLIFSRAAVTLGIGPHISFSSFWRIWKMFSHGCKDKNWLSSLTAKWISA